MKALIISDKGPFMAKVAKYLKRNDATLQISATGLEEVDNLLQTGRFQIVVMESRESLGETLKELIKKLKALSYNNELVLLNNRLSSELLIDLLDLGLTGVIDEDWKDDRIDDLLKDVLEKARLSQGAKNEKAIMYYRELEMRALVDSFVERLIQLTQEEEHRPLGKTETETANSIRNYINI